MPVVAATASRWSRAERPGCTARDSSFVFFNCFAVNMVLQYKKVGPWRDYLFGEKAYIILSLTAKALLAWQIFFPVLMSTPKK